MAVVLLPAVLAAEAGGQKRFELDVTTVGDALRGLPVRNLLFDETGELRRLINVYVDGVDARGGGQWMEAVRDLPPILSVEAATG